MRQLFLRRIQRRETPLQSIIIMMKNTFKKYTRASFVFLFLLEATSQAVVVNRVNGGMNAIYIDFSIQGMIIPLEVVRTYNSITALNEVTGWPGSFGWGWTSPFESALITTAERNVILRDGGTGNTIYFKPEKEDPKAREQFLDSVKRAYFEIKNGRVMTEAELKPVQLPEKMLKQLQTSDQFRAEIASKYAIKLALPKTGNLISNEYGLQTLAYKNSEWIRQKEGLTQIFDRDGRLIKQIDKNNFTFNFVYSKTQKFHLEEVHDQDKTASIKFTWRQDRIIEIIDNKNHKAKYTYDSNGNLINVTDSNDQVFSYQYNNKKFPHLLSQIVYVSESSPTNKVTREFQYNDSGLVIYHKEKEGLEITYAYGRNANDPENNFNTKVTQRGKTGTVEELDDFFIKSRQDGSKYLYKQETKNSAGNTMTTFTPCCGKPLQIVQNGETTNFKYNNEGLLTERVGKKDDLRLEYDSKWNKVSKVIENGLISSFGYDARGNLNTASNSRKEKVFLNYDRSGKITEILDGESTSISFKYGSLGKPIVISQKGVGTVKIQYDSKGIILKTEISGPESSSRKPTQNNSPEISKKVMKNFQNLLNIIRPAGLNLNR